MVFTKAQIDMLLLFENGGYVTGFGEEEWAVFRYLDGIGLLQPRYDKEEDLVYLSEKGKSALADYREKQLAEENRINELAKADADKKADRAIEHRFQLINSLLTAAIGGAITLFVEHFFSIVSFIKNLFQ